MIFPDHPIENVSLHINASAHVLSLIANTNVKYIDWYVYICIMFN